MQKYKYFRKNKEKNGLDEFEEDIQANYDKYDASDQEGWTTITPPCQSTALDAENDGDEGHDQNGDRFKEHVRETVAVHREGDPSRESIDASRHGAYENIPETIKVPGLLPVSDRGDYHGSSDIKQQQETDDWSQFTHKAGEHVSKGPSDDK